MFVRRVNARTWRRYHGGFEDANATPLGTVARACDAAVDDAEFAVHVPHFISTRIQARSHSRDFSPRIISKVRRISVQTIVRVCVWVRECVYM